MRLPPLNALKAFEAAARRGGFVTAAEELHVTPAAVSHQVKSLESYLETELFFRQPRGLELTPAGRELLPHLTRGFDHFAKAVASLSGGELRGALRVSAAPSFATLWLVPRLRGFLRAFPEVQIRVLAASRPPDLDAGEVDIRIPYGMGDYPGFKVTPLLQESIFPVCAPSLLNQTPLRRFADLKQHVLLHDIDIGEGEPTMTWKRWLRDAGLADVTPAGNVEFGDSILLTEAAVQGQGVALGRMSLVRGHLASGRLVRPLKVARPGDYAYYAVTTHAGAERPRVQAFLGWLADQVEREESLDEPA